jgi:pilus assembly protein CpaD
MTHMSKLLRMTAALAVLSLAALSLEACAHAPNQKTSLEPGERFPVSVEPQMMTLRLPYTGRGNLDQTESAQIARFAADYLDHGSGAIAVSAPGRLGNAPSEYADRLVALGVPEDRILVGNQDESEGADNVKLTYIRYVAQTPACGDWSRSLTETEENRPSPNFGCATEHNIAAMVADPRDLVSPRPSTPADAARRVDVLDKYRRGVPTVSEKTQAQSGTISQVGM